MLPSLAALTAFSDFHFLALADWGGLPVWPWASPAQKRVAAAMGELAERHSSAFVLSLGDHFYFSGVRSVRDARWRRTFEQVYDHPSLSGAGFWKCVAGNHDHDGNITAQLAYAAQPNSRWDYPSLQHQWRSTVDDEARTTIDFVLIDTQLLCGMPKGSRKLDRHTARHWAWVEGALAAADADYLVVGGHYPIESPAGHGPSACLRKRLEPLLRAGRATVYFSGHDHAMFHVGAAARASTPSLAPPPLSPPPPPPHVVQYHGVGAGFVTSCSAKHAKSIRPKGDLRFHRRGVRPTNVLEGGFAGVSVSAEGMTVTHYGSEGEVMYAHTAMPRR